MRPAAGLRERLDLWRRRILRTPASGSGLDSGMVVDAALLSKLDRLSLSLGRDLINGLMGEHAAVRRTSGIEFADYRQYTAGDDIRRVDWNAYARLGTLHIRQSQAEHDTVLHLLVDCSPSMGFGSPSKFLVARRLAASFGYIALSHLDDVEVSIPGGVGTTSSVAPQTSYRGRAESGNLFRLLQDLRTGEVATFDDVLTGWSGDGSQGRIAVLISDLLLDGYREGVQRLTASGFQVTVLQILSPEELQPPQVGDLELIDSETGARMEVYLNKESIAEYNRHRDTFLKECETWCLSNGANYMLVRSDWEVERIMLDMLRRRGITD